jgi:nucleotide-binding universal stress UspA family protein
MRVILIPVADRPECALALETAFVLAQTLEANVVGCHVRPQRVETHRPSSQMMPDSTFDWADNMTDPRMDSAAAKMLFARISRQHGFLLAKRPALGSGPRALWHERVGTPAKVLSIAGPVSDITVLSRPKRQRSGPARAFLLAALLHSGKPILLLPQKRISQIGTRIAIGWNQSAHAANAVTAALPILKQAERVVIVNCGPENRLGPKSSHLAEYLCHWGIKTERISTKGADIDREMLQSYHDAEADLLVMGGYSRSPFRELVFGGVTNTMLFATDIPVLMLHR